MYKDIIPHKLVIEFNDDGQTHKSSILLYRKKRTNGTIDEKYHSMSVNTQVSVPTMNDFLKKSLTFIKNQEGVKSVTKTTTTMR